MAAQALGMLPDVRSVGALLGTRRDGQLPFHAGGHRGRGQCGGRRQLRANRQLRIGDGLRRHRGQIGVHGGTAVGAAVAADEVGCVMMLLQRDSCGRGNSGGSGHRLGRHHLGGQERVVRSSAEEERVGRRRPSDAQTGNGLLELLNERIHRRWERGLLLLLVVWVGGSGSSGHRRHRLLLGAEAPGHCGRRRRTGGGRGRGHHNSSRCV